MATAALLATLCLATSVTRAADESADALASKLKDLYPATRIERVQRSELPGSLRGRDGKECRLYRQRPGVTSSSATCST
jgi:hypothetical protein